jgi:hypothetical protein
VAECIACGGPVRPEPYEAELPQRAAALRAEAARLTRVAADHEAAAAAIDAQIEAAAVTGGHPRLCVGEDHMHVPGSGCYRFVLDHDLAARWAGGGYRHTVSEPGTAEAVDELVAHIAHNKTMRSARAGVGHLAAR